MEYLTKGVYPPRPVKPKGWTFEEADKELDDLIYEWRRLTLDILEKCFLVYQELALPGARTDLCPNGQRLPTWTEWVKAKGFGVHTLTRHFIKLKWIEREEKTPELPEEKYRVLYADPGWNYGDDLISTYGTVLHPLDWLSH